MGQPSFKTLEAASRPVEHRKHARMHIRSLPGLLILPDTREEVVAFPVDVSHSGLSIVSPEYLEIGSTVRMFCDSCDIDFEVVWRRNDILSITEEEYGEFLIDDLYRYGFKCLNGDEDLVRFFLLRGCLDE